METLILAKIEGRGCKAFPLGNLSKTNFGQDDMRLHIHIEYWLT